MNLDGFWALHRYFIYADRMRLHFYSALAQKHKYEKDIDEVYLELNMYMSIWYSHLFVVIEGWKDLKLTDENVDSLLTDVDRIDALRLFRNGTFHFQKEYDTKKFLPFLKDSSNVQWTSDLRDALGKFFIKEFKKHKLIDPAGPSSAPSLKPSKKS